MKTIYQKIFCIVLFACISVTIAAQTKRYVKENGTGTGLSWDDASADLPAMIAASEAGDSIFVMKGFYRLVSGTYFIRMKEGVKIYGSFQGTETSLSERVIGTSAADSSVLSGVPVSGLARIVVSNSGVLSTAAVLDGFFLTTTRGSIVNNAGGSSPTFANLIIANGPGGMSNNSSSPTLNNVIIRNNTSSGGMTNSSSSSPALTNVTFENNSSTANGGGMYNTTSSNPVLTNVVFKNNSATWGGGMYNNTTSPALNNVTFEGNTAGRGGGLYNYQNANPTLNDVKIIGNTATDAASGYGGGGMINNSASPVLNRVIIKGNSAVSEGGGISNRDNAHPTLNNVVISGNYSELHGGGFYISASNAGGNPTLTNVTIAGNYAATSGGGIYNGSNVATFQPLVRNSIIYGNNSPSGPNILSTDDMTFTNSLVQGSGGSAAWANGFGTDGGNNLDEDPLFVSEEPATAAGATEGGNYRLKDNSSPAADAGSDNYSDSYGSKDVSGHDRVQNGVVNMGAFEAFNVSLPVNYGNISASIANNILTITWKTFNESNNDHFEIEVSRDGKSFKKAGTVAAQVTGRSASQATGYKFSINTKDAGVVMGISLMVLFAGAVTAKRRSKNLMSLFVCVVFLAATFTSCRKSQDMLDTGDKEIFYVRIVQVDTDGNKSYSQVIKASMQE